MRDRFSVYIASEIALFLGPFNEQKKKKKINHEFILIRTIQI